MCTMLFAAKLVCVQFMYSTSLEGQAVQVVLKTNKKNESQTHGLKSPIGDLRQKKEREKTIGLSFTPKYWKVPPQRKNKSVVPPHF